MRPVSRACTGTCSTNIVGLPVPSRHPGAGVPQRVWLEAALARIVRQWITSATHERCRGPYSLPGGQHLLQHVPLAVHMPDTSYMLRVAMHASASSKATAAALAPCTVHHVRYCARTILHLASTARADRRRPACHRQATTCRHLRPSGLSLAHHPAHTARAHMAHISPPSTISMLDVPAASQLCQAWAGVSSRGGFTSRAVPPRGYWFATGLPLMASQSNSAVLCRRCSRAPASMESGGTDGSWASR